MGLKRDCLALLACNAAAMLFEELVLHAAGLRSWMCASVAKGGAKIVYVVNANRFLQFIVSVSWCLAG